MSASTTSAPAGDLRGLAARGTLVNAAFEIGLTSLALVKGFIVAAFLSRSEYGIWGILVVVLVSLLWLKQVGIGDKYIQQREGDQQLAFQKAFTLELAFNGLFLVVLAVAIPLAAVVYGQPDLIAPGLVLSLAVVAVAFQTPTWVYYRSMRFGRQRTIQAVDPLVGFVVTVALAIAGLGYWALVIGAVVGATAGAVVAVLASPYPLALRYDRGTMRSYASFSWPLILARLRRWSSRRARCSWARRCSAWPPSARSRWRRASPITPTASTRSSPRRSTRPSARCATAATRCSSRS